jgi:hypothetical protein
MQVKTIENPFEQKLDGKQKVESKNSNVSPYK